MTTRLHSLDARHEEAAELLMKVHAEGAPPEAFVEMLAWCDADPANKLAMERIEEAWAVGADLTPAATRALQPRWLDRSHWLIGSSIAALLLAIGAAFFAMSLDRATTTERIATARAGHEKARLPDGSSVELGGKSSVSVVYTAGSRVVVAEDGETLYKVEKDAARPFIVRAGPVTVTAVGTAFVVRRAGESVSVSVTEGSVDVRVDRGANIELLRAAAGQRVRYDRGQLTQLAEARSTDATAWREGRLQFVDEPLRLVIASVNRYYERELLVDPAVEDLHFSGTVFENGIDAWLEGVPLAFPVRIVRVDQRRILIAPAQGG
jgi:transmembrane sensor